MRLPTPVKSTQARLLISYFCLLLPLIAFGALWTMRLMDDQRQLAVTETGEEADYMSSSLAATVQSAEAILKTVAEMSPIQEMDVAANTRLASILRVNPLLFDNISVVNEDGIRVASADPFAPSGVSLADRPEFQEVMHTGKTAIGSTLVTGSGRVSGRSVVPIAVPLKSSAGAQIGAVMAGLVLENLGEEIVEKESDEGSYTYAVDSTGTVLVHPNKELIQSAKNLTANPPVAAVLKGQEGTMEYFDPVDKQSYLAVYRPAAVDGWGIVAVHPLSLLEAARRDAAIAATVTIGLASALAFLLATLLARPIAVSMSQLVTAARAISDGKLGTVVDIKRRDEIGTLVNTFNTMSLDLAEMVSKVEEAHRQLEKAGQEIGEALASGFDLNILLHVAMRSITERLGMSAAAVALLEENSSQLHWVAVMGDPPEVTTGSVIAVLSAGPLIREAVRGMLPVVNGQNGASTGFTPTALAAALPLVSRRRCLGVLTLYGEAGKFILSGSELAGAQAFVNQVAVGVANAEAHAEIERLVKELQASQEQLTVQNEELQAQNEEIQVQNEELQAQNELIQAQSEELQAQAEDLRNAYADLQAKTAELERLQEETQSHVKRLLALAEVSRAVSSSLDLQEICRQAVESTVRVAEAEAGSIYVVNWQSETIELRASVRMPEEFIKAFSVAPINDQSASGRAILSGQPQLSYGTSSPPLTQQALSITKRAALATIPISSKGRVVGTLNLSGHPDRLATPQGIDLLMTIANQVGMAIDNAALYSRVMELDRQKEEFMSIASHELKSPLTSIKGYAQLLWRRAQRTTVDETDARGLKTINEQIDRMTRLVNELLDVSRIAAGPLELRLQPLSLSQLLKKVVENVQITTEKHTIHLDLPEVEVAATWDEGRLEEVLHNLLNNAVKYSPKGGGIWVKAVSRPEEVEVSVKDEGMGIPANSLPNLFQRFFHASNIDRINFGGLGLGLYLSQQIILRHNGRMWAESEEGKGSTFYFTLPL